MSTLMLAMMMTIGRAPQWKMCTLDTRTSIASFHTTPTQHSDTGMVMLRFNESHDGIPSIHSHPFLILRGAVFFVHAIGPITTHCNLPTEAIMASLTCARESRLTDTLERTNEPPLTLEHRRTLRSIACHSRSTAQSHPYTHAHTLIGTRPPSHTVTPSH